MQFTDLELTHWAHVACDSEWVTASFYSTYYYPRKWCTDSTLLVLAWLVPHETAAVSAQVLCTPFNCAPVYSHFIQSHIGRAYVCLVVTCHLHFWQNDQDILHATVVTRGWNGYRNKSQHRKLTLEKKILPLLLLGFKPRTFRSRVWRSNYWAILLPSWGSCST